MDNDLASSLAAYRRPCICVVDLARRSADHPFITSTSPPSPLAPFINLAAEQLENALGRKLFPVRLEYTNLQQLMSRHCKTSAASADAAGSEGGLSTSTPATAPAVSPVVMGGGVRAPWVVVEVSTGRMLMGAGAQEHHRLEHLPEKGVMVMQQLSRHLFLSMAELVLEVGGAGVEPGIKARLGNRG